MNSQTIAILFATLLVVAATLIPTYIISKRSATSEDDWAVADRSLPIYVVIGTQFASAMGGGILVGHLGNAYLNGVAILIYGFLTALPFFFILIPAKWLRQNNFSTVPEILRFFSNNNKLVGIVAAVMTIFVPFGWIDHFSDHCIRQHLCNRYRFGLHNALYYLCYCQPAVRYARRSENSSMDRLYLCLLHDFHVHRLYRGSYKHGRWLEQYQSEYGSCNAVYERFHQ